VKISENCLGSFEVFLFLARFAESLCDWRPTFRKASCLIFNGRISSEGGHCAV